MATGMAIQGVVEQIARDDTFNKENKKTLEGKEIGEHNNTNPSSNLPALTTETADESDPNSPNYLEKKIIDDEDVVSLEKKLVRKLDIRILPIIVFLYVLSM